MCVDEDDLCPLCKASKPVEEEVVVEKPKKKCRPWRVCCCCRRPTCCRAGAKKAPKPWEVAAGNDDAVREFQRKDQRRYSHFNKPREISRRDSLMEDITVEDLY